jgi:hypothetical protein
MLVEARREVMGSLIKLIAKGRDKTKHRANSITNLVFISGNIDLRYEIDNIPSRRTAIILSE